MLTRPVTIRGKLIVPTAPKRTKKGKGKRREPRKLDREACLEFADEVLAGPPPEEWTGRVDAVGELVCRLVLPLELAPNADATRHARPWIMAQLRTNCIAALREQLAEHYPDLVHEVFRWGKLHVEAKRELPGRPMVRSIRFTSTEPDVGSNGGKTPIDCLLPPKTRKYKGKLIQVQGIGLLHDDAPKHCEQVHWSEEAPPRKGFQLIEIWTGARS